VGRDHASACKTIYPIPRKLGAGSETWFCESIMTQNIFNPWVIVRSLLIHRYLLGQLIKRDVLLRYRGAVFGVLWIFLSPLLLLAIFAFVFGHIFQAHWPHQDIGIPFWLLLYCGLIAFNVFSETVSRAPSTVRNSPSYVKKIVFPLELLPIVPLGAALVHALFNLLILGTALALVGALKWSILLYPLLITPVVLLAMGFSAFLSAWGVFIKDMTQIVPLFVQMLLFLSPVFYPLEAVPQKLQPLYQLNPLGVLIGACRASVTGVPVDWPAWLAALGVSLLVFILGYAFFQHSRDEFADVL
jgi:lipopolysaccharide transport system permease protein